MSALGGILGLGESYIKGARGKGEGRGLLQMRFKAQKEWTEEVGRGKSQPEVRGQRRGGGWGGGGPSTPK